MLCLVGVLMIVAIGAYVQEESLDDLAGHFVVPVLTPAPFVVCRDVITPTCAQRAADTSKVPVAWMAAPGGFHMAVLSASRPSEGASSAEALFLSDAGGTSQISLDSATQLQPRLTVTGAVSYGSEKATLSQETLDGVVLENELRWTHAGGTFTLLGMGANLDASTLIDAWRSVRYAKPHATP